MHILWKCIFFFFWEQLECTRKCCVFTETSFLFAVDSTLDYISQRPLRSCGHLTISVERNVIHSNPVFTWTMQTSYDLLFPSNSLGDGERTEQKETIHPMSIQSCHPEIQCLIWGNEKLFDGGRGWWWFGLLKLVTHLTSAKVSFRAHTVEFNWAVLFLVKHNLSLKIPREVNIRCVKFHGEHFWNEIPYYDVCFLSFVF